MLKIKSDRHKCINCNSNLEIQFQNYDGKISVGSYCENCDTLDANLYISGDNLVDAVIHSEKLDY